MRAEAPEEAGAVRAPLGGLEDLVELKVVVFGDRVKVIFTRDRDQNLLEDKVLVRAGSVVAALQWSVRF